VIGPVQRSFDVFGWTRLAVRTADVDIDSFLGLASAERGGVTATSSVRLPGTLGSRASVAIDGDPGTAYQTPINQPTGVSLDITYPEPVTVEDPTLTVLADGRHSLPTKVSLSVDGAAPVQLTLPTVDTGEDAERGTTVELPLDTGVLTGTTFRLTIDEVTEVASRDWFGGGRTVLPVGIAELGLPVVEPPAPDTALSSECRDDLLRLEDQALAVRVIGTVGDAAAGRALRFELCDDAVTVPAGRSLLTSTSGLDTGLDVELIALASAAGGEPGVDTLATPPGPGPAGPDTRVERTGRLSWDVTAEDADAPYWVVLGQSHGDGWRAVTSDGVDLGSPTLVNGYANGWRIDPAELGPDVTVQITWPPQRIIWLALAASALGVLICLALALWRPRSASADQDLAAEPPTMRPTAASLTEAATVDLSLGVRLAVAAGTGLLTWFVAGPQVALVVTVGTVVALWWRWGATLVRLASLAGFGAAAFYIVVKQQRNEYQLDFNWVEWFERSHLWALAATLLLLVSVVVDGVAARRRSDEQP
jgi:arabinofuranan 3-O-arabinosyltransferase